MFDVTEEEVARLIAAIDYSEALTISATREEARLACDYAIKYGFRSVAVFPRHLAYVAEVLKDGRVLAMIVVGFPCGANTTRVKCIEAEQGLKSGATDLDMVMDISALKQSDFKAVSRDMGEVLAVAEPFGVPFKVIIEVGVLTDEEKVTAGKLVADAGATFVKTCTGFGPGRATLRDIVMLRNAVGSRIGIKASGGVVTIEDAVAFMRAGAGVVAMRKPLVDQLELRQPQTIA